MIEEKKRSHLQKCSKSLKSYVEIRHNWHLRYAVTMTINSLIAVYDRTEKAMHRRFSCVLLNIFFRCDQNKCVEMTWNHRRTIIHTGNQQAESYTKLPSFKYANINNNNNNDIGARCTRGTRLRLAYLTPILSAFIFVVDDALHRLSKCTLCVSYFFFRRNYYYENSHCKCVWLEHT